MKKLILSATVAFTVLTTSNIYAQQGFGTNTPDRSSAVEIVSSKRGLLIPRIDIPNLDQAAPVSNPANALMVYNTGKTTAAGFYYWDASYNNGAGRWVRFVSSNSGSAVTVSAGDNVTVTPTTDGHDTDYKVSVKGGNTAGQVLVTKIKIGSDGKPVHTTEWVNPQDFINGSVVGVNGISTEIVKDKNGKDNVNVGLGGDLTKATEINTKDGNTLAIKGLEKLDGTTGKEFDAKTQNIVIMGADGILKQVTPEALLEDAIKGGTVDGKALMSKSITVDANGATSLLKDVNIEVKGGEKDGQILVSTPKLDDKGQPVIDDKGNPVYVTKWVDADKVGVEVTNGLKKITDGNTTKLGLGGALTEATTITTDATKTLAISGLTELDKAGVAGNNVVMAGADGVLKETSAENLIGNAIETGKIEAKTLKGDGITVTAGSNVGTSLEVASALLKDVTLGIADNAITSAKIKDGEVKTVDLGAGAVTSDKMTAGVADKDGTITNATKGTVPVAGDNGTVTYQQVTGELLNGKALTSGSISVFGGEKALLDTTRIDITGGSKEGQILITSNEQMKDADGKPVSDDKGNPVYVTKWVDAAGNTVKSGQGITVGADNTVNLGGKIDTPTTLAIDSTKGSLAISGLTAPAAGVTLENVKIGTDGKLYAVTNAESTGSITINKAGDITIEGDTNYSVNQEEVVIEVALVDSDTNLKLPTPSGVEGQTISVKITNTKEDHNGYLNIQSGNDVLAYGAMPFQGWIIKSNGTKWIVVGRN